jgi:hypothetical protein
MISIFNNKLIVLSVSTLLITSLSACGGGGDSSTPLVATPTTPSTTVTAPVTTALKSASAKDAAALVMNVFDGFTINFDFTSVFQGPVSQYQYNTPCSGGGSTKLSITNPNGIPNSGDSYVYESINCTTKNGTDTSTDSFKITSSILSQSASAATAGSSYVSAFSIIGQGNSSFDETFNGVRQQGTSLFTLRITNNTTHDGKGTASVADDVDTELSNIELDGSTTIAGVTRPLKGSMNGLCARASNNSYACEDYYGTLFSTSIVNGDLDLVVTRLTPIKTNTDKTPISGSIEILDRNNQGAIIVVFSVVNNIPTVSITQAQGSPIVLSYADLQKHFDAAF